MESVGCQEREVEMYNSWSCAAVHELASLPYKGSKERDNSCGSEEVHKLASSLYNYICKAQCVRLYPRYNQRGRCAQHKTFGKNKWGLTRALFKTTHFRWNVDMEH